MKEYTILRDLILHNAEFEAKVKHKRVNFNANELIIEYDKVHPNFYFIIEGAVIVRILEGHSGFKDKIKPVVVNLSKYNTFGEMGLFDNSPAISEVSATLETEVIEIDKKSFTDFLSANIKIGYAVMIELFEAMCSQIQRQNKNFYHLLLEKK